MSLKLDYEIDKIQKQLNIICSTKNVVTRDGMTYQYDFPFTSRRCSKLDFKEENALKTLKKWCDEKVQAIIPFYYETCLFTIIKTQKKKIKTYN